MTKDDSDTCYNYRECFTKSDEIRVENQKNDQTDLLITKLKGLLVLWFIYCTLINATAVPGDFQLYN